MITETRREREKRELRNAILEAARDIATQEGWEAVTIRKISSAIEYGAPAIYALFENKEAILLELIRDGYRRLLATFQEVEAQESEPEAKLRAIGRAYWDFADRCPRLFKVMNGLDGVPFNENHKPEEVFGLQTVTINVLKQIMPDKKLSEAELEDMAQILRATVHGLVVITMAGKLKGGKERAEALLERAMQDLLTAWRSK